MSMQPKEMVPVPEETARIARAVFPKGNVWLILRDELGMIFCDDLFADLYPRRGQPAEAPWRLALVTVMQFVHHCPSIVPMPGRMLTSITAGIRCMVVASG